MHLKGKSSLCYLVSVGILTLLILLTFPLHAQQIPLEVAQYGYADTVLVNGKVVSMDDKSTSSSVGRVYQAVAVKGNRIVKLGTSGEIRALAGPDTRVLDLKGRTLIPGIIEPHMHIYGEAIRYLDRFGFEYPPNGIVVSMQAERDMEKTQALMREKIQEAVRQARPGQWVVLSISGHPEAPNEARLCGVHATSDRAQDTGSVDP